MNDNEFYIPDDIDIDSYVWNIGTKNNVEMPILTKLLLRKEFVGFLELMKKDGFKQFAFSVLSAFSLMSICDFINNGWHITGTSKFSFRDGNSRITRECLIFEEA